MVERIGAMMSLHDYHYSYHKGVNVRLLSKHLGRYSGQFRQRFNVGKEHTYNLVTQFCYG